MSSAQKRLLKPLIFATASSIRREIVEAHGINCEFVKSDVDEELIKLNFKGIEFNKFISSLDYISIHCPLNRNTENLITIKELKLMKHNLILINTARGGIVNEVDLTKALKRKIIAGAGIDVTTAEPPKPSHAYYSILNKSNFIWTPHTAWASQETLQGAINQLIENINSFYKDKKRNIV